MPHHTPHTRWITPLSLVAVGCLGAGCVIEVRSDSDSLSFEEEITAVVVDVGEGDVQVLGADLVGAEVYRSLEWSGARTPEVSAWVEGGTLFVTARCAPATLICRVDHELVVPQGAEVWIETGAGQVTARGGQGPLAVQTGSGDVVRDGQGGDVQVSTGSGNIEGWGLGGAWLEASTGSGDVALEAVGPLEGMDVSTGSGDVTLEVPGGRYALEVSTGSGDVSLSGVSQDRSASRWIDVDTGSGDVVVVGRSESSQ